VPKSSNESGCITTLQLVQSIKTTQGKDNQSSTGRYLSMIHRVLSKGMQYQSDSTRGQNNTSNCTLVTRQW